MLTSIKSKTMKRDTPKDNKYIYEDGQCFDDDENSSSSSDYDYETILKKLDDINKDRIKEFNYILNEMKILKSYMEGEFKIIKDKIGSIETKQENIIIQSKSSSSTNTTTNDINTLNNKYADKTLSSDMYAYINTEANIYMEYVYINDVMDGKYNITQLIIRILQKIIDSSVETNNRFIYSLTSNPKSNIYYWDEGSTSWCKLTMKNIETIAMTIHRSIMKMHTEYTDDAYSNSMNDTYNDGGITEDSEYVNVDKAENEFTDIVETTISPKYNFEQFMDKMNLFLMPNWKGIQSSFYKILKEDINYH